MTIVALIILWIIAERFIRAWERRETSRIMADYEVRTGRCAICAFHRFDLSESYVYDSLPPVHTCPDERSK